MRDGFLRDHSVPDEHAVRAALATVEDPEIHQPITDLGMVGDLDVGRRGRVRVRLLLTTASCPLRGRLEDDVTAAVRAVPGVADVRVELAVMSEPQRLALGQRLRAASGRVGNALGSGPSVYAVASGKGGVGKSTITANLAVALAHAGRRVGVLDADVWGHSIPQLFGVHRAPVAVKGMMLPVESYGVRLVSTGFFVSGEEPIVWRGPMLHKALEQFITDVYWGEIDVLLVDLPPGTGDVTLSLLELLPAAQLLAVTTPQPAAQQVAARVGAMATDAGMPVAGVVENMSELVCACCAQRTALFGSGGGERLADGLGVRLLGRVPLDVALREAGDAGEPVVARDPGGSSAHELTRIAGDLPVRRRSLVGVSLPLTPA